MKLVTIFIVLVMLNASCKKQPQLIWSDEFDYTGQPDSSRWNYQVGNGCPGLCGWGNNEEEYYTDNIENIHIENGVLIINAIRLDSIWTSARITTKGKFNFTFGRIEFRAKLPGGIGTWPALWMLNGKMDEIGWPKAGEIDIMEHVGRRPGVIQSSMHTQSSFGKTLNTDSTFVDSYHTDFHVYSAEWSPEKINVFVDDNPFYTYRPEIINEDTWPFHSPFYLIINLAMGGSFGGPIDPALSAARMEVDYVRVYQ